MSDSVGLFSIGSGDFVGGKQALIVNSRYTVATIRNIWCSSGGGFADMRCQVGFILLFSLELSGINLRFYDLFPSILTIHSGLIHFGCPVFLVILLSVIPRRSINLCFEGIDVWASFVNIWSSIGIIVRLDVWCYIGSDIEIRLANS